MERGSGSGGRTIAESGAWAGTAATADAAAAGAAAGVKGAT